MFSGSDEERSDLAACNPTDAEAEVHVLQSVSQTYIDGLIVHSQRLADRLQNMFVGLDMSQVKIDENWCSLGR
jgi:hypothetical protein